MRLKKGSKVEVFSKKEVPTGSWYCAEVMSGNGHTYNVRYGRFPMPSDALVERVPRKAIRPCPPLVEGVDIWVPGDHVELFQNMSWKTATVVKALDGNNFLVRLVGEYEEIRVHKAHLRVRQSWEDDKWVMVGKGDVYCKMSMKKNWTDTNTKLYAGEDYFQVKRNMGVQEPYISTSTRKRASSIGFTYLEAHDAAVQKVRAIEKEGSPRRICAVRSSPLTEKVDAHLSPLEKLGGNFNDSSLSGMPRLVYTDSCASSVGSCSANGIIPYRLPLCSMNNKNEDTESFCSDAESFCGCGYEEEGSYLSRNEELVAQDHGLELCTYRSAMQALYASGPLSWEDEMKVTDIRRALHISNDEHLRELRHLIAFGSRIPIG
ncbi:DUF724 domain-containing protein [Actinidia chinensis var. chinensis]|uniref:DUF724 domain-containing protein n=1 Tax=Actinidia chinensis var. chinensis TaxID=1590841 RepID=A0A2R6QZR7_ACTCC|nr:DUF724 domain-containing protein [Actinidia chinensis var. chinensis]